MKSLKPKKLLLMGTTCLTVAVLGAGFVADHNFSSQNFVSKANFERLYPKAHQLGSNRLVASNEEEKQLPKIQYIPFNQDNRVLVNGLWKVMRLTNFEGKVIFDSYKNREDLKKNLNINASLVGTSMVMLDNDPNQVFRISFMPKKNSLVLFRGVKDGFEVLEALREAPKPVLQEIKKAEVAKAPVEEDNKAEETSENEKRGIRYLEMPELYLISAINPARGNNVVDGEKVVGQLSLESGSVSNMSVRIEYPNGVDTLEVNFARLNDGGQFTYESADGSTYHGVVMNNGKSSYRVRMATGPLQGAILDFVTPDKFEEVVAAREEEALKREEAELYATDINQEEPVEAEVISENLSGDPEEFIDDQSAQARNRQEQSGVYEDEYEYEEEYEEEYYEDEYVDEANDVVHREGFDFSRDEADVERDVASEEYE